MLSRANVVSFIITEAERLKKLGVNELTLKKNAAKLLDQVVIQKPPPIKYYLEGNNLNLKSEEIPTQCVFPVIFWLTKSEMQVKDTQFFDDVYDVMPRLRDEIGENNEVLKLLATHLKIGSQFCDFIWA